jgi:hypothetical protein
MHEKVCKSITSKYKDTPLDCLKLPQPDYRTNQNTVRHKYESCLSNIIMPPISRTFNFIDITKPVISTSRNPHFQLSFKKSKSTYRIAFNERNKMKLRNLIILHFEGTVGDILPEHFEDEIENVLCVRKGNNMIRLCNGTSSVVCITSNCFSVSVLQ